MSFQRPIASWLFALALIVAAFLAVGLYIRNSVASSFETAQQARTARMLLFDAIKGQLDEETGLRGYLATRDRTYLDPYRAAAARLPANMRGLTARLEAIHLPAAVDAMSDAQRVNDEWMRSIALPLLVGNARNRDVQRRGRVLVDRFRRDAAAVDAALNRQNTDLRGRSESDLARLGILVVTSALTLFVAGLTFAALQSRVWNTLDREREGREEARLAARSLRAAYEAEKRIADTLQEGFSQRVLPTTASISFSATYVPATEEAKVGGDWYDAFEIGPNRILFTIGDIAGHGLMAAVAMSRVRNEMLSAALLDPSVDSILARVNRGILNRPGDPMVTAIVGIADARNYEFTYATAGHPPPVLLEPNRPPRLLDFGGLPLGVSDKAAYRSRRIQSVPGAMLVLYTDGAIEHSRNIIAGELTLLEAVAAAPAGGEAATAIYDAIFHDKPVGDDVAILTVGFATSRPDGVSISAEDGSAGFVGRIDGKREKAS
jgi:serine phosphatase RsbU (regulator of sigma subunit)